MLKNSVKRFKKAEEVYNHDEDDLDDRPNLCEETWAAGKEALALDVKVIRNPKGDDGPKVVRIKASGALAAGGCSVFQWYCGPRRC